MADLRFGGERPPGTTDAQPHLQDHPPGLPDHHVVPYTLPSPLPPQDSTRGQGEDRLVKSIQDLLRKPPQMSSQATPAAAGGLGATGGVRPIQPQASATAVGTGATGAVQPVQPQATATATAGGVGATGAVRPIQPQASATAVG